jgi:hypothetical protein
MEVFVNRAGKRVFVNAPYIDQSEYKKNLLLYDPNGYNLNTGLYDRTQMPCARWVDYFHQFQKEHPTSPNYAVDRDGRTVDTWADRYYKRLGSDQNFMAYRE